MRRAMICVSVMLALFQIWPMIFGQNGVGALAAAAPARPTPAIAPVASAKMTPIPAKLSNGGSALKSCQAEYQAASSLCSSKDPACNNRAIDKWDICDATGFWPE